MNALLARARAAAWLPALALPALLLLAWLCYRPGLGGPLLLDDEVQLPPIIGSVDAGNWTQRAPAFLFSTTGPAGRPVAMASLLASVISHGNDVHSYKRENVLLHLLCGVLLFAWVRQLESGLARRAGRPLTPLPAWPALLATALWLLHPLLVGTVLYTIQRMTILSTLFTLAGLLAWSAGREAQAVGANRRGILLLGVSLLVCLPLAILSKENGVLLLPLCGALELTVYRGTGSPRQRRALRAVFGLLLVLPLLLALTVLLPRVLAWLAQGYSMRDFTLGQRLLSETRVIVFYLAEWFLPIPANLSFYHDDIAPSQGWLQPWTTLPSVLLVAALLVLAVWLRQRLPAVALGLMVFLIGHSLEGTLVPLELAFEHRNYLPDIGLALALALLPWHRLLRHELALPVVRAGLALGCLTVLAVLTLFRCEGWSSREVLFPVLFEVNPDSPRLAALFANTYANGGQFDVARQILARQHSEGARMQRLDIDCMARQEPDPVRLDETLQTLHGVIAGYEARQIVLLVNDALEQKCGLPLTWGLALVDRALALPVSQGSSRQLLWLYRGHLHRALHQPQAAQEDLQKSAAIDPGNPLPMLLATEWALQDHELALARSSFTAAGRVTELHRAEYDALFQNLDARLRAASP